MTEKKKTSDSKKEKDIISLFTSPRVVATIVICYVVLIMVLLLAEMDIEVLAPFRATDKVLMLFALLFVPFFILAAPKLINTFTIRLGNGKEVQVQLNEITEHLDRAVVAVHEHIAQQVSTAEQALWPMLAGQNVLANKRLGAQRPQIIIGSKFGPTHVFLANFLKAWIERRLDSPVECVVRLPNGGSLKNFADVRYNWVDLYIDYTGTCSQYFSMNHRSKTEEEIIEELNAHSKSLGMRFIEPLGATEDYCLVMRKETAAKTGAKPIETIADLALVAEKLTFTADPEFLNRRDCWLGLQQTYGLGFKAVEPCQITNRYALLEDDQADVFVGYETDPEITLHNLVKLRDDEQFFPIYSAIPLVNQTALDLVNGLEKALAELRGQFTTDHLIQAVHKIKATKGKRDVVDKLVENHCERIKKALKAPDPAK